MIRLAPLIALAIAVMLAAPAQAREPLDSLVAHDLAFAEGRLERTLAKVPANTYPNYTDANGEWVTTGARRWVSGFLAGQLWLMYEATGDPRWRRRAERRQAGLAGQRQNTTTHDLGFVLFNSFGNGYRLTGKDRYRQVAVDGARSLATRWNARVGAIRSWNNRPSAPATDFRVIIDGMMNLELLRWAAANGGKRRWSSMAKGHALRTLAEHVRTDGSTYHLATYASNTGAVKYKRTVQGYDAESTWSRGQAWAIYGFAQAYRSTGDPRFLAAATRLADWFVARLPRDGVPFWDFGAPGIPSAPRDSSAAAIAASALLDLSRQPLSDARAGTYAKTAKKILTSLSSPAYLTEGTSNAALLAHGTGHKPSGLYDTGLVYGDYYFLEALVRYRALKRRGSAAYSPSSRTPLSPQPRWWATSWRSVRSTCARSRSGSCPKSRSSVSR